MKKKIKIIFSIMLTILVITNCSQNKKGNKIKIKVAYWGNIQERKIKQKLIRMFEKTHPNVKIIAEPTDWPYFQKILTIIAGNNAPDIFLVDDGFFREFASRNSLLSIDDYVKKDMDYYNKNMFSKVINTFKYNGKFYGLPNQFFTEVIYYNKEMFNNKGISYPEKNWKWNNAIKIAQKLTDIKQLNKVYGFASSGFNISTLNKNFEINFYKNGKCVLNTPSAINFAQFLIDVSDKYKIIPNFFNSQSDSPLQMFWSQRAAMIITGQYIAAEMISKNINWGVINLPIVNKLSKTRLTVHGFVISSKTKYPKISYEFLKFAAEYNSQKLFFNLGINVPVNKKIFNNLKTFKIRKDMFENFSVAFDSLVHSSLREVIQGITTSQVNKIISEEFEKSYKDTKNQPIAVTMKKITKRINKLISEK